MNKTITDHDFYYTINQPSVAEFKDRGSKFIAYTYPITTIHEAKNYLQQLKKEHPKAVHHCFAYRIGIDGNNFRASDDGEPGGTAGKPILNQIDSKQLTDIAVIVVRYFGGTLFEAFLIRNQFNEYINVCKEFGVTYMEVSDGSIDIPHAEKCGYIEKLTKHGTVLSEVGSKDAAHIIPPYKWIELMRAELEAGSSYVIAEAREAGNVGIYRGSGEVREGLVQEILTQIPHEKIIWEAPQKAQQLYFLELIDCNVNLGNIAPNEVIPLESMRIGLRGDTFHLYLNK